MTGNNLTTENIEFVGIDFGHGESSVATIHLEASGEPQVLDYQGQKTIVTAVTNHPQLGVLIGDEAIERADESSTSWLAFKDQQFEVEDVSRPTEMFIEKLIGEFKRQKLLGQTSSIRYLIGCPSGWKPEARAKYKSLLKSIGLNDVVIMSESRAAFFATRHAGELKNGTANLSSDATLIIDMGSSTIDFTAVSELQEKPIDFGDNRLGGGLIDKAILRYIIDRHEHSEELRQIFSTYPSLASKLELLCRKAKEGFFSKEQTFKNDSTGKASGGVRKIKSGLYFEAEVGNDDMQTVLSESLPNLGNLTWADAYQKRLLAARDALRQELNAAPSLVILTGGASRMGLALDICEQVFPPPTRVIRGKEPEFAIARGLALAGRFDVNIQRYRSEVKQLIESKAIHQIVEAKVDALIQEIAQIVSNQLVEFFMDAFEDWKQGNIGTLREVTESVKPTLKDWLEDGKGKDEVVRAMRDWFVGIDPDIKRLTNPICKKYGIDPSAFQLNETIMAADRLLKDGQDPIGQIYDEVMGIMTLVISAIIGAIVTIVSATVAGPGGFILVTVISLVIGGTLMDMMKDKVLDSNIARPMRRLARSQSVRDQLQDKVPQMRSAVVMQLSEPQHKNTVVDNLVKPIKQELERDAERAERLIR